MKILLVTGVYRSGKGFTQKILDSHQNITMNLNSTHSYFKICEKLYFDRLGFQSNERLFCLEYFEPDELYRRLFENFDFDEHDVSGFLKRTEDEIKRVIRGGESKLVPSLKWVECLKESVSPGKASVVFEQICESIHKYKGKQSTEFIGLLEVNLEQFVEPLVNSFGERIKVIQILRDPRAILASRNYGSYVNKNAGGKLHPILMIARVWRTSFRYQNLLESKFPKNFLAVKYENLICNSKQVVKLICDFLELEFSEGMLSTSDFKDDQGQNWRSDSSYENVAGFDKSTIDRWKEKLPDNELSILEYLCSQEMLMAGYVPDTCAEVGLDSLIKYREDLEVLRPWTKQYDLLLDLKQKEKEIARHYNLIY